MTRWIALTLLATAGCHSPETRQKIESMDNGAAVNGSAPAPAQPQ